MTKITQRADLTFKFNRSLGRHGWLRLTPAYSVKIVQSLVANCPKRTRVLDPFSGTGTTALVAAEHGNEAQAYDINPFLIWLGNVKCRSYSDLEVEQIRARSLAAIKRAESCVSEKNWRPPIFNIERWWAPNTLNVLAAIRESIELEFGPPDVASCGGLVWVAFCRLVIETSSAAFNHVSMSFAKQADHFEFSHVASLFTGILEPILESSAGELPGTAQVSEVDARHIPNGKKKFGKVITSPPYPNRISYIRELRPYMYWTGFLKEAREAGELDWKAVGGTWGVASSRLLDWEPDAHELPPSLAKVVASIAKADSKHAKLLSAYVMKYFHDMALHFRALRNVLAPSAELHYIVGNSTFYGNMVDTSLLLSEAMTAAGFHSITSTVIRKRNCNKALFEYDVSAVWE